ncbi:hypothetical protein GCM10027396_22880 [Insolitispirillum peregrinum]
MPPIKANPITHMTPYTAHVRVVTFRVCLSGGPPPASVSRCMASFLDDTLESDLLIFRSDDAQIRSVAKPDFSRDGQLENALIAHHTCQLLQGLHCRTG